MIGYDAEGSETFAIVMVCVYVCDGPTVLTQYLKQYKLSQCHVW